MEKCIKCGKEINIISQDDLDDGYSDMEDICYSCLEEQDEIENTCPIHNNYCSDGFCEYCIIENKKEDGLPLTSKEVGIRPTIL